MPGIPDRFEHYPDPPAYTGHVEDEDAPFRPYVGARSDRSSRDAAPVVSLPASRSYGSERCSCGYPGAETDNNSPGHLQAHMQWSLAVTRTLAPAVSMRSQTSP